MAFGWFVFGLCVVFVCFLLLLERRRGENRKRAASRRPPPHTHKKTTPHLRRLAQAHLVGQDRAADGLAVSFKVVPGETHATGDYVAMRDALEGAFAKR